jgi:hypothetical protein
VTGSYGAEIDGVSARSIVGGYLDWVGVDGFVHRTEIATGVTEDRFEIKGDYDVQRDTRVSIFTDDAVSTMTWEQADDLVTFRTQDRESGALLTEISLPVAAEAISHGLVLHDLAVRP